MLCMNISNTEPIISSQKKMVKYSVSIGVEEVKRQTKADESAVAILKHNIKEKERCVKRKPSVLFYSNKIFKRAHCV